MSFLSKKIAGTVAAVVLVFGSGPITVAADGKELFAKNCTPCHGPDGKAQTPIARKLGVKDLTQSKLTEAEIEKQILEGKRDEHGKEKMPPFKTKLSTNEVKSLVAEVKALRK
jgi:mono/diheme cytochrome c family protein